MRQLPWSEAPEHYESLAVSLRAIAASFGVAVGYDDLIAGLGLGSAFVASPDEPIGRWSTLARDMHLADVADLLGLRLRELHPPDAAFGLSDSREFTQHFHDSYVPLIARAIEHGQLVLAWRGWSPPREDLWGVITAISGQTIVGHSLWHEGTPTVLSGAAHRVAVVEECATPSGNPEQREANRDETLLALAQRAFARQWANEWHAGPETLSAGPAFAVWSSRMSSPPADAVQLVAAARQCALTTRVLTSSRRHLARFLRRHRPHLIGRTAAKLSAWAAACDELVDRLLSWETSARWEAALESDEGRAQAIRAIEAASSVERAIADPPPRSASVDSARATPRPPVAGRTGAS